MKPHYVIIIALLAVIAAALLWVALRPGPASEWDYRLSLGKPDPAWVEKNRAYVEVLKRTPHKP